MTSWTVLIVDDHAGFRAAAREFLARLGYDVVGEAADARQALLEARRLQPTLVLLDVRLPDLDGFEVSRLLRAGTYPPVIVLVSTHEADDYRRRIETSGVAGFITKSRLSGDTLLAVLRGHREVPS